ncbi:type-2 serine--tRNA ligase [Gottschalkia purinilytica]|uniref:Type-2 serine--tRNA ligase n=1 Tax=Gottschalkia purinilytica TaxID=1503 RepID=A0A0L0W9X8_GOTPU|nr:aminoacyl--tRNA ligase-related protein [Gottschalkia purinilytica]KNF08358.1 type-2 serine--tRNA ligase [Gottschalkia purinilytica]
MEKIIFDINDIDDKVLGQLCYSIYFIDENIEDVRLEEDSLIIEHKSIREEIIKDKVKELVERYSKNEFPLKDQIVFTNNKDVPFKENIIEVMVNKKIIKQVDLGMYIFREPFITLLKFFDDYFVSNIAKKFNAKHEYYPVVIKSDTLNKTNHFTSFPEHVHFVTHLNEDIDLIKLFIDEINKSNGWNDNVEIDFNEYFKKPQHMINPATCYHCYEGMKGETLDGDGTVVTAVSKVHRYESKNHKDIGRLMDFTMREIIFVGNPNFVKENRAKSLDLLKEIIERWELDCWIENANDMFFTNDFQVKASFQRKNDMKYELKMNIPYFNKAISVSSSNFHSATFGKAFDIKSGKRPVVTGCLAFGLERWVIAFLSQYGLDSELWPKELKKDYDNWCEKNEI